MTKRQKWNDSLCQKNTSFRETLRIDPLGHQDYEQAIAPKPHEHDHFLSKVWKHEPTFEQTSTSSHHPETLTSQRPQTSE